MFEVHQGIGLLSKRFKPGILPPGAFEENGQKLIFVEQKRISITSYTEQNKKKLFLLYLLIVYLLYYVFIVFIVLSTAFTHFVGVQVGSILKSDNWGVADA